MAIEEIIVPFPRPPAEIAPATHVRGSVLVASLRGLRGKQLLEPYLALRDPKGRDAILATTASSWVPVDDAIAHYQACDKLALPASVVEELGSESGRLINASVLAVIVRVTKEAGATPWAAFSSSPRLLARTWQGSAARVVKLGPKEARFDWVGQPVAVSPYYRLAYAGFMSGVITLFCRTAVIREIPKLTTRTSVSYRCSWV